MVKENLVKHQNVSQYWRNVILGPMIKKGRKRKSNILHKTKLPSLTLFSKLHFESEHINAVKITKNIES